MSWATSHCGSLQKNITLAPGEEIRLVFMLGEGNREAGRRMREKYSSTAAVDLSYADLKKLLEQQI